LLSERNYCFTVFGVEDLSCGIVDCGKAAKNSDISRNRVDYVNACEIADCKQEEQNRVIMGIQRLCEKKYVSNLPVQEEIRESEKELVTK